MSMRQIYAVIGKPVEHSLSPILYDAAFRAMGMDAEMIRLSPPTFSGEEAVSSAIAAHIKGLAVTIPYKEGAMLACKSLSKEAETVGAVNSVRLEPDGPIGHNTDPIGIKKSLQVLRFAPHAAHCLVVGAGGAARAVVAILAENGAKQIDLICRTPKRGSALARDLSASYPATSFHVLEINSIETQKALAQADLMVNATPTGMAGTSEPFPLPLSLLNPAASVFDLVYVPDPTSLASEAARQGRRALSGKIMFLEQMLAQFEFLTGHAPPREAITEALDRALSVISV